MPHGVRSDPPTPFHCMPSLLLCSLILLQVPSVVFVLSLVAGMLVAQKVEKMIS